MGFPAVYILLALSMLSLARDTCLADVKRAFNAANIPEILNISFEPKILLEVTFPQTAASSRPITLHAGILLPLNATAMPPFYNIVGPRSKGPFVVAMIDPDAPSAQAPTIAQVRHFLGGNFFLHTPRESTLLTNNTPSISPFINPAPSAGSGLHRYIFLLFDQPESFPEKIVFNPKFLYAMFNVSAFAENYGLGQPIGGSFMVAGPDAST